MSGSDMSLLMHRLLYCHFSRDRITIDLLLVELPELRGDPLEDTILLLKVARKVNLELGQDALERVVLSLILARVELQDSNAFSGRALEVEPIGAAIIHCFFEPPCGEPKAGIDGPMNNFVVHQSNRPPNWQPWPPAIVNDPSPPISTLTLSDAVADQSTEAFTGPR
jgi:hypothetical protein